MVSETPAEPVTAAAEGLAARALTQSRIAGRVAHAPRARSGNARCSPTVTASLASGEPVAGGVAGPSSSVAEDGCTGFRLAQQLWDQRLQAAARSHVSAASEQWDLLVENGNAHASAIMELMKDVNSLKSELGRQKGELKGCVNSLMMMDKRSSEQTERLIKEHHERMAEGLEGADRKHRAELECLQAHLVGLLSASTRREQEARTTHVQESVGRCEQELRSLRAELRSEHDRHAAHFEDRVRHVEDVLGRHQDGQATHVRQLEETHQQGRALEAAVKEHAAWVDEVRQRADQSLAQLEELRSSMAAQDGQLERASRELLSEVKQDHDRRAVQIKDELHQLDAAIRRGQEAHAADVEGLRLQMKRERADFAADLKSQVKRDRDDLITELLGNTGRQTQELQDQLRRVEEDLRSHWHNLSYSESFSCGLPEPSQGEAGSSQKALSQEATSPALLVSTSTRCDPPELSPRGSEPERPLPARRCGRRAPFELGPVEIAQLLA